MTLRSGLSVTLVVASLAAASCGGDTNGTNTTADPFVGTWTCTGSRVLTFTTPMNFPSQTQMTSSTLVITESGSQIVVTPNAVDGGSVCIVRLAHSGSTATISAGQTCANSGQLNGTATFTAGTATVIGNMLTSSYAFTFSGMVGMTAVAGTATEMSTCTR